MKDVNGRELAVGQKVKTTTGTGKITRLFEYPGRVEVKERGGKSHLLWNHDPESVAIIDVPTLQLHEQIDHLEHLKRQLAEYRRLSLAMLDIIDAAARNGWDGTLDERDTVRELEQLAAKGAA